jgi:hypothetical protein
MIEWLTKPLHIVQSLFVVGAKHILQPQHSLGKDSLGLFISALTIHRLAKKE